MSDLLVIADDLTGAADCGITCASHGLNTVVVMGDSAGEIDADVLCVDGNTRHLEPEKAAAETARLVRRYSGDQTLMLFKKLDSTLRGNIAAELAASLETRRSLTQGGDAIVAVLAPAYPATGRTTSNGRQIVHGLPLEETEIWQTQDFPTRPDIPEMLHRAGLRSALIRLDLIRSDIEILQRAMRRLSADADVLVCDAEIDQDLSAIAEASMTLGRNTVWAGSAGLAYHLPWAAGFPYSPVPPYPRFLDQPLASGPTLFVVGSLSSVSRDQVKVLAASSETVACNIPPEVLLGGESSTAWHGHELELERALGAGRDIAVFPDSDGRCDSKLGQRLSTALGRMVLPCADRVGALVVTGGESARAVLESFGIHRLRLVTELESGLACSVTEGWSRQLPVLTKAGAFGTRQTLLDCQQFLNGLDRSSPAAFFQRRGQ